MKTNCKKWVIALASVLGVIVLIAGLCTVAAHKMHSSKADIYNETKTFVDTSVLPEIKTQRGILDNSLTPDEKLKITELRTEAKAIVEMFIGLGEKYHSKQEVSEKLSDTEVMEVKKAQKQMRYIVTQCWTILDAHEAEFDALDNTILPKLEEWHIGFSKIISKHIPFHGNHKGHGKAHGKSRGHFAAHTQISDRFFAPVLFLIYEPETNFPINMLEEVIAKHIK